MIKVNAQEWLESQEKYNTKEKRNETTKLDISNKNLEKKLNLSDFVNLEELNCSYNELTSLDISKCSKLVKLNCSYNLLDNLEFLDKCSERLLFLSLENCCSKTFFREEIKEKTKRFKNLVPLDLKKYKEKKRSESYSGVLNSIARSAVSFVEEKGQEWILSREIEKEKEEAKNIENSLSKIKDEDNEQKEKLENDLERIRDRLGSMNKATIIIINSNDPDQVVIKDKTGREENDGKIGISGSEDKITLNVEEVEQKEKLESLKELRKQVLYGQTALESVLKHEKIQKFQKFLDPFYKTAQREQEIRNKLHEVWKSNDEHKLLDEIKLIIDEKNEANLSEIKKEIKELCENKEWWAWTEYKKNKPDEAEKLYNNLKEKNSTFSRLLDINYYGSKNAELYMLYTRILKKELPEYIEKVKEELGTKFIKFNEKFKRVKGETFGDYVVKKLADSGDFYFSPDRVWKEIENTKEKVLGQILDIAPTMQYQQNENFENGVEEMIKENYYENKEYKEEGMIYENKRFSWKIDRDTLLSKEILPTRLYDISEAKIKETNEIEEVKNYAIVSYVWGAGSLSEEVKKKLDRLKLGRIWESISYKNELNLSGYRALIKAIETCRLLNIKYLWMDQLCTNQGNNEDKNKEVPKMRQYYSNSSITLISIDGSLRGDDKLSLPSLPHTLRKIVGSKWFTRSWTFQEGWLSKQTVFMFDDELADGRAVAQSWVLNQPVYTKFARYNSLEEAAEATKKIATPLGWTYYRGEYDRGDEVNLSLGQVLKEIKDRGRGTPIDGIYSILGLLPYGHEVEVNYKPRICRGCVGKFEVSDYELEGEEKNYEWGIEAKNCKHNDSLKKWPIYSKKDIAKALYEVMKTAVLHGYGEPFAWHGESNGLMPEIINEKGSTGMIGGLVLVCKCEKPHKSCEKCGQKSYNDKHDHDYGCAKIKDVIRDKKSDTISYGDIEVEGMKYFINSAEGNKIVGIEANKGFLIEGGLYKKSIKVEFKEEVSLIGSKETLSSIKENDLLIVLDKDKWESESPFAILVARTEKDNSVYYRKGIVGFDGKSEAKKLESLGAKKEKLPIDNKYEIELQQNAIEEVEKELKNYGLPREILGKEWKFSFRGKVKEKIDKEKENLLDLARKWFEVIKSSNPSEDYDEFVLWLKNKKELVDGKALERLEELRREYSLQKLETKIEVNK